MVDRGYFGGTAYLNVELGYLFRSGQADAELKKKRREAQARLPRLPRRRRRAIPASCGISAGPMTPLPTRFSPPRSTGWSRSPPGSFGRWRRTPRRPARIDTFLNYYLPTTQKLLDSYAEFEAAGVEGENLRQAKSRIEATMDAIVRGFEHQLDELYKADALDVDSDIRVMETMLRRDTASVEEDFGLGSAAAQQQTEKDRP